MLRFARRLLAVLVVFAIVGGPSAQLARPAVYASPITMADMPCNGMASMADAGRGTPMAPCQGLTPDCVKQMGCVVDVGLPARLAATAVAFPSSPVAYWSASFALAGVVKQPEPLPPRTT